MDVPESFYCSITQDVMQDPVVTPHGITFERTSIEQWLRRSRTCPVTRNPLTLGDLTPNRALKYVDVLLLLHMCLVCEMLDCLYDMWVHNKPTPKCIACSTVVVTP